MALSKAAERPRPRGPSAKIRDFAYPPAPPARSQGMEITPAWLYVLRLRSGGLYIGVTRDRSRRWREHVEAHGSGRTTASDPPVAVVYSERHASVASALRRERQLKGWTRAKKEALVAGDCAALRQVSRRCGRRRANRTS